MRSIEITLLIGALAICAGCSQPTAAAAPEPTAPEQINFLSIVVDPDTAAADTRLKRFLEKTVADNSTASPRRVVRFQQQTMPYGDVIRAFAEADPNKGYLARITPYAYVAAEMLGAKLSILAVYKSAATNDTTYHSYFVVRKDRFQAKTKWTAASGDASLEDVLTYLKNLNADRQPARFVYHDRFSTSSYFMPSLYFKANEVFAMSHSLNPRLIPIRVERLSSTSSSDLVHEVAAGKADLAAVWDGTKTKFKDNGDLLFIRIPTAVPNDFLVSSGICEKTQRRIVEAITKDPAAGRVCTDRPDSRPSSTGLIDRPSRERCDQLDASVRPKDDFDAWHVWDSNESEVTDAAREALAKLRQDARQPPRPVVVKVESRSTGIASEDSLLGTYVDAAKEAVRLSGTEFVLEDRDLHRRVDMTWILESTHDGALKLRSELDSAFRRSEESFSLSFVDSNDLPRRIADLVRSRLRRVRYIWPYEQKYPAVLRDLDFTPDQRVLVQKISWIDATRNEYEEDTPFEARIENNTDFSKLRLTDEIKFPRNADGSFNFDPMSNIAYRVIIAREPQAGWIWVALPYCFIALFTLACVGLAFDLRRQQPPPTGLHQTYQRMVEAYHRPWRRHELDEGEILWCDPKYMDEVVKELKSAGSFLDVVKSGGCDFNFGPLPVRFSVLMNLGSRLFGRRPQLSSDLVESSGGGCVAALDRVIQFVVCKRRLSPFVGFPESTGEPARPAAVPIEWEALNDITSRHFQRLGISDKPLDAHFDGQDGPLATAVSGHFRGVIKRATHDVSLFRQTWLFCEPGADGRLFYERELRSALTLRNQEGVAPAHSVRVQVNLPSSAALAVPPIDPTLRAWVFGKILNWSVESDVLCLQVRPIAVLRDYAHQH